MLYGHTTAIDATTLGLQNSHGAVTSSSVSSSIPNLSTSSTR